MDFFSDMFYQLNSRLCGNDKKYINEKRLNIIETFQIYNLKSLEFYISNNYCCMFLASILKVACGTSSNRFLLISFPVTRQIP